MFKKDVVQKEYMKLIKPFATNVEFTNAIKSSLKSYLDTIDAVDSTKLLDGFKEHIIATGSCDLSTEWKSFFRHTERSLGIVDKRKFNDTFNELLMLKIAANPLLNSILNLQCIGDIEATDHKYYYLYESDIDESDIDESDIDEIVPAGFTPIRNIKMKTGNIREDAEFDVVTTKSILSEKMNLMLDEIHVVECKDEMLTMATYDVLHSLKRIVIDSIKKIAIQDECDMKDIKHKFMRDTIEEAINSVLIKSLIPRTVVASPDVVAMMTNTNNFESTAVDYSDKSIDYDKIPCGIYTHNEIKVYVFRDIDAVDSYMLTVDLLYNKGAILIPYALYRTEDNELVKCGLDHVDIDGELKTTINIPYAFIGSDECVGTSYRYTKFDNVTSILGIDT